MISKKVTFLAACNPYKKRDKKYSKGLVHKKLLDDPMSMLKYRFLPFFFFSSFIDFFFFRVFPLVPFSLDYIIDFGEIQMPTQKLYIKQMVINSGIFQDQKFLNIAIEVLHHSQQIADKDDTVSMRDIRRCVNLMSWFMVEDPSFQNNSPKEKRSIILALTICYFLVKNIFHFLFQNNYVNITFTKEI